FDEFHVAEHPVKPLLGRSSAASSTPSARHNAAVSQSSRSIAIASSDFDPLSFTRTSSNPDLISHSQLPISHRRFPYFRLSIALQNERRDETRARQRDRPRDDPRRRRS